MIEKHTWRTVACREPLLVSPKALGHEYQKASVNRPYGDAPCEGIYVIDVHGPLEHHEHQFFASFENVSRITCEALERSDVKAIVWRIDSPGGVANGMGSASRELRARANALGKPIYAYADEQICSAAYGIACAADEIWCPPTAEIGSIGVILPVVDQTVANAASGVQVELLVTGERKGDGHPDKPLDAATIDALQSRVDAIGADFFELVAESRNMSADNVRALQAAVFVGETAVNAGLADGVALWSEFFDAVKFSVRDAQSQPTASNQTNPKTVKKTALNRNVKGVNAAKFDALHKSNILAKKKGVHMARSKKISLAMARKRASAAIADASTIADPAKRSVAIAKATDELAAAVKLAASRMYKKTIKVEESVDDDKDDDEPESEREIGPQGEGDDDDKKAEEDDAEDAEEEGEEDAEEEGEEDAEEEGEEDAEEDAEEESEDDPKDDDEKKDAKRSRKGASVIARLREITGARSRAELLGRLDAMAEKAKRYESLEKDVSKLKRESTAKRVDALIKSAIDARKIAPSNAKQIAFLRAQGMESPKRLAAYVEAMPRLVARTLDEGPVAASLGADGAVKHLDELSSEARKVVEITARTTGISIEKATADYLAAYNRAAGR